MKAEELMIGDWVMMKPFPDSEPIPNQIVGIEYNSWEGADYCDFVNCKDWDELSLNEIEPIPLTPQLLRRLGFEKRHNYWQLDEGWTITVLELNCVKPQVNVLITNYNTIDKTDYDSGWQDIIYLHELQHAMKLCRIDKKFEL